jgi:molybdopterin-containing oxidoreductase family iron-sulfur binding subunit
MSIDRRKFIKAAGLASLAGLAGKSVLGSVIGEQDSASVIAPGTIDRLALLQNPLQAKRWAMAINIKKCLKERDCTKCIDACHLIHNVPEFDNRKDEIKWIWKEPFEQAFTEQENEFLESSLKHSTPILLCNHCDNPPCVSVCPTQATWKREDGIVMMDWHRCIGCRYCMAGCPYGSRSFNWRDPRPFIRDEQKDFPTRMRGVVEKCTFCEERLALGSMPACVEACTPGALVFGDLEDPESDLRRLLNDNFSIRRKPGLGTQPEVYYIIS